MEDIVYDGMATKLAFYMAEYTWLWTTVFIAHVAALVYIAKTNTKDKWYYKLIESIAVVFGKAKDKAPKPNKKVKK